MALKLLEDHLHLNRDTIRQILLKTFGKRKICAKFVAKSHMSKRSTVNSDLILRSSFGNVTEKDFDS